jgi:hypothetical protein
MTTARGTVQLGGLLGGLCTVVLAGALAYAPASEANVYKWKDSAGIIHYTDKPPPADGVLISIEQTANSRRNESQPSSTPAPAASRGPSEQVTPGAQARLRNSVQNDVANAQGEQCKQAKERYQMYVQSRRLFKEGPNKERVYLSDQELEEARLNAKREMDELCGATGQ